MSKMFLKSIILGCLFLSFAQKSCPMVSKIFDTDLEIKNDKSKIASFCLDDKTIIVGTEKGSICRVPRKDGERVTLLSREWSDDTVVALKMYGNILYAILEDRLNEGLSFMTHDLSNNKLEQGEIGRHFRLQDYSPNPSVFWSPKELLAYINVSGGQLRFDFETKLCEVAVFGSGLCTFRWFPDVELPFEGGAPFDLYWQINDGKICEKYMVTCLCENNCSQKRLCITNFSEPKKGALIALNEHQKVKHLKFLSDKEKPLLLYVLSDETNTEKVFVYDVVDQKRVQAWTLSAGDCCLRADAHPQYAHIIFMWLKDKGICMYNLITKATHFFNNENGHYRADDILIDPQAPNEVIVRGVRGKHANISIFDMSKFANKE